MLRIAILIWVIPNLSFSQGNFPHLKAHAHNDYEHERPLWNALEHGFISVEADVHLTDGRLLVSHNRPKPDALTLQELYLAPLDSLLTRHGGSIYPSDEHVFYLMIDSKTEAEGTYRAIQKEVAHFESLRCTKSHCPVKIFISGNRAVETMVGERYQGIGLDGRPGDLGKGISAELMPVVSDHYSNWSSWKGKTEPNTNDLDRIRELAQRVHAEGKKLRLWAIPDHEVGWSALLDAGVDLISSDRLGELHLFLSRN